MKFVKVKRVAPGGGDAPAEKKACHITFFLK
jgi:hypothetical protein